MSSYPNVRSMTGFGRGQSDADPTGGTVAVEVRSVNQRFLKVNVKLPGALGMLEPRVREAVGKHLQRGAVDVFVNLGDSVTCNGVAIDGDAVQAYVARWRELANELQLEGDLSVNTLAALPTLFAKRAESVDGEALWPAIGQALDRALNELQGMRRTEGQGLAEDLAHRVNEMRQVVARVAERAPQTVVHYRERLRQRLTELLSGDTPTPLNSEALEREVAFYADRSDISEELQRLGSHLDQVVAALETGGEVGKRLEFLAQEIHREVNTIGSKSADSVISTAVVDLKGALEKLREQSANIE